MAEQEFSVEFPESRVDFRLTKSEWRPVRDWSGSREEGKQPPQLIENGLPVWRLPVETIFNPRRGVVPVDLILAAQVPPELPQPESIKSANKIVENLRVFIRVSTRVQAGLTVQLVVVDPNELIRQLGGPQGQKPPAAA